MKRQDLVAALVGGTMGLIVAGYALIYAPMRHNYLECGRVTLCASVGRNPEGEDREDGLRAEHEHAVPEGQTPTRSRQSNKPGREM